MLINEIYSEHVFFTPFFLAFFHTMLSLVLLCLNGTGSWLHVSIFSLPYFKLFQVTWCWRGRKVIRKWITHNSESIGTDGIASFINSVVFCLVTQVGLFFGNYHSMLSFVLIKLSGWWFRRGFVILVDENLNVKTWPWMKQTSQEAEKSLAVSCFSWSIPGSQKSWPDLPFFFFFSSP